MGYVTCYGDCIICGGFMCFNPVRVPSIRVNNVREPVCGGCMMRINSFRQEHGREPIQVLLDAYDACNESEIEYED